VRSFTFTPDNNRSAYIVAYLDDANNKVQPISSFRSFRIASGCDKLFSTIYHWKFKEGTVPDLNSRMPDGTDSRAVELEILEGSGTG